MQQIMRKIGAAIGVFILLPIMIASLLAIILAPGAIFTAEATNTVFTAWDNIPVNLNVLSTKKPSHVYMVDAKGNRIATFYSEDREEIDSLD